MSGSALGRPGAHSTFVMALLVALLVLTGLLAFQAVSAARSHREVAERTLAEFARVAAWEYAGAARRILFSDLTGLGLEVVAERGGKKLDDEFEDWVSLTTEAAERSWPGLEAAEGFFSLHVATDSLEWRTPPEGGLPVAVRSFVRDSLPVHARTHYDPRWSQAVVYDPVRFGPRVLVYRMYAGSDAGAGTIYGFVIRDAALLSLLRDILKREAVLPSSTLGLAEQEDLLSVEVREASGELVTATEGHTAGPYTARDTLGLGFGRLAVGVAIVPEMAETLVIGGLQGSRIPTILLLLVLTTGTVVAAFLLLRRESELNALRADFVSSISHELRTPIAQIRMFGETLLLDRIRNDEERRRSLEILVKESRRLAHQVDNVLLFSRAEREKLRYAPERIDLAALLAEVAEGFAPLAETREMTLATDLDEGLVCRVDRMALEQAVLNLLDNAVKYGPAGQTIRLEATAVGSERVRIAIEDEGPGIPESARADVWEPYSRLDRDRESAVAGTGIGLAVVREVVEAMGGTVRIGSGSSGGARIELEFERAGEEAT